MKLRKYISVLLAAVYLFAVGGQAVASLSCHCIAHTHVCCHHCAQHPETDAVGNPLLSAPCCDDNHSTEVELYTSNETNASAAKRIVILDLPAALIPQVQDSCEKLHSAAEHHSDHRSPLIQAAPRFSRGMRAPPVLA